MPKEHLLGKLVHWQGRPMLDAPSPELSYYGYIHILEWRRACPKSDC